MTLESFESLYHPEMINQFFSFVPYRNEWIYDRYPTPDKLLSMFELCRRTNKWWYYSI